MARRHSRKRPSNQRPLNQRLLNQRPLNQRPLKQRPLTVQRNVLAVCFVSVVIILAIFGQHLRPAAPIPTGDEIRVHFVDVGQGDAILIQSEDNAVLIDAGPAVAGPGLAGYLEHFGVTVLDFVVATHPHADHIGGMPPVLDRFEVRELWVPDVTHDTATFERFLDAAERNDLEISTVAAGDILSAGLIQMTVVAPNRSGYASLNDYSIVLHMRHGATSFLFTGDAEAISENEMVASGFDLRADVLNVGHHGSRTSSTDAFLDAVQPFAAVIQLAAGNQFGHPHQDVLNRLAARDIMVLRTDELGTIVMSTDGVDIYLYE